MTDDASTYTVKPNDTLSGIAKTKGVPWTEIAKLNDIHDPRALRVGTRLRMPAKGGKINTNTLDAERNPLPDAAYKIRCGEKEVCGRTTKSGQLAEFVPEFAGQTVEIFFQKLNGDWKKVYETVSEDVNKLVTLVSPRLKINTQTEPHPPNGGGQARRTATASQGACSRGSDRFVVCPW